MLAEALNVKNVQFHINRKRISIFCSDIRVNKLCKWRSKEKSYNFEKQFFMLLNKFERKFKDVNKQTSLSSDM